MSNSKGQYCKDPDESTCNVCLSERKSSYADNIFIWRELTLELLGKAEQIIAPSHSTKKIYKTTFPELKIDVCYHDDTHKLSNYTTNTIVDKQVKIAVLGSISIGKGSLKFLDFIQYTLERNLPYKFVCIGVLDCKAISVDYPNLTITGNYDENNLDNLIKTHNPNIFWFPAQSPETFCFTLSEALRTGLPVIASDIGAFSERLRDRKNSTIIPWNASNSTIADSFQKIIRVETQ